MTYDPDDWNKIGSQRYAHPSGAVVFHDGQGWIGLLPDGTDLDIHGRDMEALIGAIDEEMMDREPRFCERCQRVQRGMHTCVLA